MPTPVNIAVQCLTPEASHALDEAVLIAKRRSHSQTTSLHLISAFLALPSSSLRDACARVGSTAYPPKYQFKALELSFTSALDRLPSSQPQDEPPISNSLMAAIKRSQANQRRNPESFHLYQQQQQQQVQNQQIGSSLNCVKVELQNLVLSILDDPIVSRVFAEAGFRSCDVKLAILRPLPPLGRFHRSRRAPLFLCNLTEGNDDLGRSSYNFNFPFMDDSFGRIGEILGRKKERNPLLIGVSAIDTLRGLPGKVFGLKLFSIEKEILEGGKDIQLLAVKFEELEECIEKCNGLGVVVSFGDLSLFLDDCYVDGMSYVVSQLSRLLEMNREKLWLIGAAAKYEMYLKFLMKFPSIEKDWDLQLLPITSVKSPVGLGGGGGFQSRPQSLTESFVPFGGFFSTTSDLRSPLSCTPQPIFRCHLCNEKYEQELSAFLNGGFTPSVADHCHASLPPWLQNTELGANRGLDMTKAKDDGPVFRAKVTGLQNKWNDICRRLHHCSPTSKAENPQVGVHVIPVTMGLTFLTDKKENANNITIDGKINALPSESDCGNAQPSMRLHKGSSPGERNQQPVSSDATSEKACELNLNDSNSECLQTGSLSSSPCPLSGSSIPDDYVRPSSSVATVATDLGLGTLYSSTNKEPKKLNAQTHRGWFQDPSDCSPTVGDVTKVNISNSSIQSPSRSAPDCSEPIDPSDLKSLWRCLVGKVGRQNEAMQVISQTIVRCKTGSERRRGASLKRDLWFNFVGLDRVAKRRTALALAEILFGSKQNIISLDLSAQDGMTPSGTIFGCGEIDGYDIRFRGKMAVDYIVEEIRKKPLSIVFLENINKADMLLQKSLSQAIKTGKIPDSRGRETSISNTVFITTSTVNRETKASSFENICTKFSEERVLGAQNLDIQMLIDRVHEGSVKINHSNLLVTLRSETPRRSSVSKRKLVDCNDTVEQCETYGWLERAQKTPKILDLNLPIEEAETIGSDTDSNESETVSENTETWLQEFLDKIDGTAVFKPFDFDALANRLLKEISLVSRKTLGSECLLEIDSNVLEQMLAAAWLSDRERAVEDWVEQILGKSFVEARKRYSITGQSVLKLVSCDDCYVKEQASGVCLPSRIILN